MVMATTQTACGRTLDPFTRDELWSAFLAEAMRIAGSRAEAVGIASDALREALMHYGARPLVCLN